MIQHLAQRPPRSSGAAPPPEGRAFYVVTNVLGAVMIALAIASVTMIGMFFMRQ